MKVAATAQKPRRQYQKHGLTAMKRALMRLSSRALDGRYAVSKELKKWRDGVAQSLGGNLSEQEDTILDICVRSKLMLDSIDAWLLTQDSLVNKRKKAVIPAVKDRKDLARDLVDTLKTLGIKQKPPPQKSLEQYVEEKYGSHADDGGDDEP